VPQNNDRARLIVAARVNFECRLLNPVSCDVNSQEGLALTQSFYVLLCISFPRETRYYQSLVFLNYDPNVMHQSVCYVFHLRPIPQSIV
jgi:hypothetical protein